MKKGKKLLGVLLVLSMLMAMFSGCTSQEQSLFKALNNAKDIKSCEGNIKFKFNVSLKSGGTNEEKQMMMQAAPVINGSDISMHVKSLNNDKNIKSYINMKINNPINPIGFEMWQDVSTSGSVKQVVGAKQFLDMLTMTLPREQASKAFSGKEYFVFDSDSMKNLNGNKNEVDTKKLQEAMTKYVSNVVKLSKKTGDIKLETGDKGIVESKGEQTIKVNNEDVKADLYTVKLNDEQFKKILALNKDFTKNNEAIINEFKKVFTDYIYDVMDATPGADKDSVKKEMEKSMKEMAKYMPKVMEGIRNTGDIKILGDEGIAINYFVKDGNIVKEDSTVDILIDVPKLAKLIENIESSVTGKKANYSNEAKSAGVYDIMIKAESEIYNINKIDDIKMPELNKKNSLTMDEFTKIMENMGKQELENNKKVTVAKVTPKTSNVVVNKKLLLNKIYVPVKAINVKAVYSNSVVKATINGKTVSAKTGEKVVTINGKKVTLKNAGFMYANKNIYVSTELLKTIGVNIVLK